MSKYKWSNNGDKRRAFLPKVVATGALLALFLSVSAAPVSSYSARTADDFEVAMATEHSENANYSLHTEERSVKKPTYNLPGVPSRNVSSYKQYTAKVGTKTLSDRALRINDMYYLPVRAYFNAIGASVSYNAKTKTATIEKSGLYLTMTDGTYVMYANDRAIFNFSPIIVMSNGKMYAPMQSLLKVTGQKSNISTSTINVSGTYSPLVHAQKFYREDEVFWLARIITAEAKGESLLGQIAVGNVVINRVKAKNYPNTIYGVIFDRKYGVQFSPILNGTIYNTPTYSATLAAKIILEGTRLSENAMYFLNPRTAQSSWIVNNREYLYTIGGHDFYS